MNFVFYIQQNDAFRKHLNVKVEDYAMKNFSKNLKEALSFILVMTIFICGFTLPGYATLPGEDDVVISYRWRVAQYYSKYYNVYSFVLSPNYIRRADVIIYDSEHDDRELVENEEYTVHEEEIPDYGTCFVITLVTDGASPYLKSGSFKKKDGNSNATIYLIQNHRYTEGKVASFDKEIKLAGNALQVGDGLTVDFRTKGCISVNNEIVAENVYNYTWEPEKSGEYLITLSVYGLTVGEYPITVMTPMEIKEDRIDELKNSLPKLAWNFFKSIPIAILTLPTLPLVMFGWVPGLLGLGPIEYAIQFFDALSEIRQLKA